MTSNVNDTDNDAIAFELVAGPAGMSINASNGKVRWLPVADQLGTTVVSIRVTDPQGGSAIQTYTLNTHTVGGPPRITSVPPTQAAVGQGYLYSVAAVDAEQDPLRFALLEAPVGMTIDDRTGEIAWNPTLGQVGLQQVIISVSDLAGGTSTQGFAVQVQAGAPNLPPVIATAPKFFATVDQQYSYDVLANDPEGTALVYSLRRSPAGMQINAATGRITWTPTDTQTGRFTVTVLATDAGNGCVDSEL